MTIQEYNEKMILASLSTKILVKGWKKFKKLLFLLSSLYLFFATTVPVICSVVVSCPDFP